MKSSFDQLLTRFGQDITLTPRSTGEPLTLRAFLQPILKRREELPITPSPLGAVSQKRWLYLGSAGQPLATGDRVDLDTLALVVQEERTIYWQDTPLYRWAILRERKEAAQ